MILNLFLLVLGFLRLILLIEDPIPPLLQLDCLIWAFLDFAVVMLVFGYADIFVILILQSLLFFAPSRRKECLSHSIE